MSLQFSAFDLASKPLSLADPSVAAALDYKARGWDPVPVEPRAKKPIGYDWANQPFNPARFRANNVGIVLGRRSGWLVDVDIDCPEALELADLYLPPTGAEFGRASKPRSHRLYYSEGATAQRFDDLFAAADPAWDRAKTMLVELRSDGAGGGRNQTVMPPSVHLEQVRWDSDGEPARISAVRLRANVAWLAAGALILRHVDRPWGTNFARNPSLLMANWVWGGWPDIGTLIYRWLGRADPLRGGAGMPLDDMTPEQLVAATENAFGRDLWVKFGLAVFDARGEAGEALFYEFSRRGIKHHHMKTVKRTWRSIVKSPPRAVTWRSLRWFAENFPRTSI